ncbi:MAG: HDOD domain-containing protein [Mariprofundales bacterium]
MGESSVALDRVNGGQVLLTRTPIQAVPDAQEQLRQHALAHLIGVRHPGLPLLITYGIEDDMEIQIHDCASYTPLLTLLPQIEGDRGQILHLIRGVLWGLAALEERGLYHGQLHPGNILVSNDGDRIALIHPLYCLSDNRRRVRTAIQEGSLPFISPQQVTGHPVSIASDFYALGVLVHTLVSGKSWLMTELPVKEQLKKIVQGGAIVLSQDGRGQSWQSLVDRCIQRDRQSKALSTSILLEMVEALGEPALLPVTGTFSPAVDTLSHIQGMITGAPPAPMRLGFDTLHPPMLGKALLRELALTVQHIPPLPEIWFRVEELMADPASDALDIATEVEKDPVLISYVLKIVNSPAYAVHGNRQQTNVAYAIARLGMETTQTVLLEKIAPEFGVCKQSEQEVRSLWFHAQAVGMIARVLAKECALWDPRQVGMMGLLHDIGKLIIIQKESPRTLERLRLLIAQGMPVLQAEWQVLGYTHIDVGMILALHWGLPRAIHQMIGLHHHPDGLLPEQSPQQIDDANLLIHVAHLVLQHQMRPYRVKGIWQPNMRCHTRATVEAVRTCGLDLESPRIVDSITVELRKLAQLFPDVVTPIA